jgi:hypothetical protein
MNATNLAPWAASEKGSNAEEEAIAAHRRGEQRRGGRGGGEGEEGAERRRAHQWGKRGSFGEELGGEGGRRGLPKGEGGCAALSHSIKLPSDHSNLFRCRRKYSKA